MTRGCAILLAVASTWPSPHLASGFLAPPMQSPAAPFRTSIRRYHSCCPRCALWPPVAAAAISAATAATAVQLWKQHRYTGWGSTTHSSGPRGGFPAAGAIQGACRGASFALGGAARRGGQGSDMTGGNDGGRGGGGGGRGGGWLGLDVDEESLALAPEAAKKEDYQWYKEFIGTSEDDDGGSGDNAPASGSSSNNRTAGNRYVDEKRQRNSGQSYYDNDNSSGSSSRRQTYRNNGGDTGRDNARPRNNKNNFYDDDDDYYSSSPYYNDDYYDVNDTGSGRPWEKASSPRPRGHPAPRGRAFQSPSTRGVYEMRGERNVPVPAAADTAYDYDIDDEFDEEPGRGGWDYDPGLAAGVGARQRDVDAGELRAQTRAAAMRVPLEEEAEGAEEAVTAGAAGMDAGGVEFEPVSGDKVRQRDVDAGELPAQTRAAAMRVPLEEEKEGAEEAVTAGGAGMGAGGVEFEPVSGDKVIVLTGELGYTEQEVACIDPDMADLAIERGIRRPASGMPDDWVGVGAAIAPPSPSSAPPSSSPSSPILEGEGGGNLDEAEAPALPGALNLDEILNNDTADKDDDTDDDGDFDCEGRQRPGGDTRRVPPPVSSLRSDRGGVEQGEDDRRDAGRRSGYGDIDDNDNGSGYNDYEYDDGDGFSSPPREQQHWQGKQQQGQQQQQQQQQPQQRRHRRRRRPDSSYYEDDERGYDMRGGSNGNGREANTAREDPRYYYYQDGDGRDYNTDRQRQQQQQRPRRRREQGGERGRRGERARPARELDPAEKYERSLWGAEDDEDENGKIWTGVGPDGPWPTLEEFTKLLREETDVRLSIVGPWAAEIVAVENKFRLQAYKKWLELLDKGIGESLEESGVFDAGFLQERESEPDKNLYDDYTNYGYPGREEDGGGDRGAGGFYGPRGGGDEWGLDYEEGRRGLGSSRRRGGGRGAGRLREDERPGGRGRKREFDVGSFLKSVPDSFMKPAAGMEEAAARFESKYPGKKSPPQMETPAGAERDGNDYYPGDRRGSRDGRGWGLSDETEEEEEEEEEEGRWRRQQQRRRARGGGADEYRRMDGYLERGEDFYEY